MKTKADRSERLRDLLRATHRARENPVIDARWGVQTMRRIRQQAAAERPTAGFEETFFWRWFAAGGVAAAVLMVVVLNFQFIPDADLWSILLYENETLSMMQAFLY